MQIRELELLAPAKNKDIGIAAIDCGADALYIAGPAFGARESAGNSVEDIAGLIDYAHRYSAKVFIALNTIIYDNEIDSAKKIAHELADAGADALIIQDLGLIKAGLPNIPLHASTQTNIRTPEQARFLESLGFERLILARELSLTQISAIRDAVNCDLEFFVHGALCVSYSGQCYMSMKMSGRSANRGACMQSCRLRYNLEDKNGRVIIRDKHLLSLKDMNLSDSIPALVRSGITSFKIEGRLKNISYIKNIVKHYREKIDEFIASAPGYRKSSFGSLSGGFVPDPDFTFNRGYTSLFIDGSRGAWKSIDSAKGKGERIGVVKNCRNDKSGNLIFEYESHKILNNGDGLFLVSPAGREAGARAGTVEGFTVYTNENVSVEPGWVIYRNYNHKFEKSLDGNMPERLLQVSAHISYKSGVTTLKAVCEDGREVCIERADIFPEALNRELSRSSIERQISRVSEYFRFTATLDEGVEYPFYPASFLNSLRRDAAKELSLLQPSARRGRRSESTVTTLVNSSESKLLPDNLTADYRLNIANRYAEELYRESGAESVKRAYEIDAPAEAELMRTKYCIKYELGRCPFDKGAGTPPKVQRMDEPLFLVNGANRFRLAFDCSKCEMVIYG